MASLRRIAGVLLTMACLAAGLGAAVPPPGAAPHRTCTWHMRSITFPGHDGSTSSRATEDSCHWYYHARAKCYRANGTHYYSNGTWRFSTLYASIAYCGSNEWLTRAWFQKFRNGKYYLVYP
jgi:hypothetical protein